MPFHVDANYECRVAGGKGVQRDRSTAANLFERAVALLCGDGVADQRVTPQLSEVAQMA